MKTNNTSKTASKNSPKTSKNSAPKATDYDRAANFEYASKSGIAAKRTTARNGGTYVIVAGNTGTSLLTRLAFALVAKKGTTTISASDFVRGLKDDRVRSFPFSKVLGRSYENAINTANRIAGDIAKGAVLKVTIDGEGLAFRGTPIADPDSEVFGLLKVKA
jgi:hypothetical protein